MACMLAKITLTLVSCIAIELRAGLVAGAKAEAVAKSDRAVANFMSKGVC